MFLTKKQSEVFSFLKDYFNDHGYTPTFDEIARQFGFNSKGTVYKHIKALKAKGVIAQSWNRARGIEIIEGDDDNTLPVLGVVAAGQPIAAIENPEAVTVPGEFIGRGEHYVLRVQGDSMEDEHIADGDLVVVNRHRRPREGDTVVALIDNSDATIKSFYRRDEVVELRPANRRFPPQIYPPDRISLNGVVVGVLRKY